MKNKKFCGVLCRRGMYIIPPPCAVNENGFPDGWGVRSALPRSFFFPSFLLVSYDETFYTSWLCAMAHADDVLTESLTEYQYQCDIAHIMCYLSYVFICTVCMATPLTEQVSRSMIRCYG